MTTTGGDATLRFVDDTTGAAARRLTVVHSAAEPKGRATLAVWLRAAEGLGAAAFSMWRKNFSATRAEADLSGNTFVAEVAGAQGPMRIEADVATGERRMLAGGEPAAVLSVNGRDVGREIWAAPIGSGR